MRQFYGRLEFLLSFCRKTLHVHKIPRFRGRAFWVLGGGGGECRFYFYGRRDFSEWHNESGSCAAIFGMLRCRSCTATFVFLQCACHFDQSCAAASEKLHCNIAKAAFQQSGAFLPPSCGFQAPKFRHPRLGPAEQPFLSSSCGAPFCTFGVSPDDAPHAPSTQCNTEKKKQRFFI